MNKKRFLAALLTLVMLVGLLPTGVLAARTDDGAVPLEAPSDETDRLETPVWTDAEDEPTQAELAEVDTAGLTNITSACDIDAPRTDSGRPVTNMYDGDKSSFWGTSDGAFPADVTFTLPQDTQQKVHQVVLWFETAQTTRGITVALEIDGQQVDTKTVNFSNPYIYELPTPKTVSTIKVTLSNPTDNGGVGAFWPGIFEAEIWAVTDLTNIAASTTVSNSGFIKDELWGGLDAPVDPEYLVDGNPSTLYKWAGCTIRDAITQYGDGRLPWVNLAFSGNRSVKQITLAFENKGTYDQDNVRFDYKIYGKTADSDSYNELFSGQATLINGNHIKTHTLSDLTELSDIKVEFQASSSEAWPIIADISVLGIDPYAGLINVIEGCTAIANNQKVEADNLNKLRDGKLDTLWLLGSGTWPTNLDFTLPTKGQVRRVEIDFESGHGDAVGISLGYTVNSVTDSYYPFYDGVKMKGSAKTLVCDIPADKSAACETDHLRITMNAPTNGDQMWPALAEVRIYLLDKKLNLTDYQDITERATPTPAGSPTAWDFGSNQQVAGFRVTLADGVERVAATVQGQARHSTAWTNLFTELTPEDNALFALSGVSKLRLVCTEEERAKITNIQIFGTYTKPITDSESVAFDKVTHSRFPNSYLVNDGDKTTAWEPTMYPACVDIALDGTYDLSAIEVYTPTAGYSQFTVYTSANGRDFDLVGEKLDTASAPAIQDDPNVGVNSFTVSKSAQVVRVYLEYYSENEKPRLNEVRVTGTRTGDAQPTPAVTFTPFNESTYNANVTEGQVIAEVQGIIERQVGAAYVDWFTFELADQSNYDYFTLADEGSKIKVTGNNGVSLATGVNHYLKYFCNVNIAEAVVASQRKMPAAIVPIGSAPVHKETKYPIRYAFNYCTHSYSMSFWDEAQWRNELDWLALNGVNLVLDITGQELVWYEFLTSLEIETPYTSDEAKDFLVGPGYYAWAYMANITGLGGPIHDSFLTQRMELGRENQRIMRVLGMQPVLQAFSGMVPIDLPSHDPDAVVIPQDDWTGAGASRPSMLNTKSESYVKYAETFYAAQEKVFGKNAHYYATDPFHEGGSRPSDLTDAEVSRGVMENLLKYDDQAVWVIQSWQSNPTGDLLYGLRTCGQDQQTDNRAHALVLDLYAERFPHNNEYGENTDANSRIEFSDTPWVWCQLNNFGGRMGLDGHLDSLVKSIPATANASDHMKGVGMAPEASQENPLLYDFLFETIWTNNADQPLQEIDLDQWLANYARRRYGAQSENAVNALNILAETVYNGELRTDAFTPPLGNKSYQGAPESVINARPALSIDRVSTWGNSDIFYSKTELERAAQLLLDDYDTLSASDAYLYDLVDILKQVLANTAQDVHSRMASVYRAGDLTTFTQVSDRFLALIDKADEVLGTRKEFLFGTWTTDAQNMATAHNADDFAKRLYLCNAKALVTTWASRTQCNNGQLHDYSNRQWAGLTKDFYKGRWVKWINSAKANLAAGNNGDIDTGDWFQWEWEYVRSQTPYSPTTNGENLKTLGEEILTSYSVLDPLGEKDLDPAGITVKTGSEHTSSEEDDAAVNVLDRDAGTIWHTDWTDVDVTGNKGRWWVAFDLGSAKDVDSLRYLPRQSSNDGRITGYEVYVSSSDAAWTALNNNSVWPATPPTGWTRVAEGSDWANDLSWKQATFTATSARYVVLKVTASTANGYCSAAEVRITAPALVPVERITLDQTTLALYTNEGDGHSATLTATVTPENATNKAVNWSVSPTSGVALVENGVVTAVGNGTATITAASQADPTITATCTVTVKTKITGQVTISVTPVGDPVFGSTLTATLGNIAEDAKAGLSYAWYHGETAEGATIGTESSYDLKQADIGQKITLKVTASGDFEGSSTATTEKAVGKAAGENMQTDPTSTPCSDANTSNGAITGLNAGRRYQWQKQNDDETWPDTWTDVAAGATSIDGLSSGNYRVRRWFDPATHTPGSFANVRVGVANVPEYAVARPNDDGHGNYVRALPRPAEAGATVTVTVTTVTGWELTSLTATNDTDQTEIPLTKTQGKDDEYTFTMPASAVTLTPTFAQKSYTITYDLSHAVVDGEKPESVLHGDTFFFTLAPESEYYVLPDRIQVTDADGREVAHTYSFAASDEPVTIMRIVGFTSGIDRNITVKVTAKEKIHRISHNLTNINCDLGDEAAHKVAHKAALNIHLTPAEGYCLPLTVQIAMGATTLTDSSFTYDRANGIISFAEGVITGNLEITAEGVKLPAPLSISADPATLSGGGQVSLSVIVPEEARDAVFEGIDLVENISTQLSVVCDDPAIQTRLTLKNQGQGLVKLSATLPNATKTYTFTATLAANEQQGYPEDTATCTVAVTKTGGSGGSGSSGGGSASSGTSTKTEVKEDGSKVTTVTDNRTGTVTETVEQPDGTKAVTETKKDGTVTETVTTPEGAKTETVTTKDGDVTITATDPEGEELAKVDIPATIPEPEEKFDDLSATPWAEEAIHKMAGLELVNGTGGSKYDPIAPMTRGSLATVLHRLSQGKTDYENTFKDVAQGKYYTEGVAWAARAKVVTGYTADTFAPDDIITREQLAVMLSRYAKLIGMDTKADEKALDQFADGDSTGSWAIDGVAWCVENGILKGKGENDLDPTAKVTRAEVAVMLDRFIALLK